MPRPTQKFVFSHHPCIDGVASAWALQQAFPDDDIVYQGLDHNDRINSYFSGAAIFPDTAENLILGALHQQPAGQEVFFVDYVPNDVSIIEKLLTAGHKVTIYDHHQTSLHNLQELSKRHEHNPNFHLVFDEHKSGATITWTELHPDTPPHPLLQLIETMDLLTFTSDEERKAACYIDGYLNSPDQEENIYAFTSLIDEFNRNGMAELTRKGADEYRCYDDWKQNVLDSKRTITLAGHEMTVVDAGDIMLPPRGLIQDVIDTLTRGSAPPVLLMVDASDSNLIKASVRVHPDMSDMTDSLIRHITADHAQIKGGGRGTKGQIGQGKILIPPKLAAQIGVIQPAHKEQNVTAGRSH